jgi:putative flippase GtrA
MSKLLSVTRAGRKEGERFFKFLVVGAIGFVVDAGTFFIMTSVFRLPDRAEDVLLMLTAGQAHFAGEIVSQAISFAAAIVSNFTWNRYWTYPDSRSKSIRRQLAQFTTVNLVGLLIRSLVFIAVRLPYERLGSAQTLVDPVIFGRYASLATAVSVVLLWNFLVNRYWTYNDVS